MPNMLLVQVRKNKKMGSFSIENLIPLIVIFIPIAIINWKELIILKAQEYKIVMRKLNPACQSESNSPILHLLSTY